jgi:hypothetical protein
VGAGDGSRPGDAVWSLLAMLNRQYGGNEGYDDSLGDVYRYDSTVPNGRHVSVGDVVVLRDAERILGAAASTN